MRFSWDDRKARRNERVHGVSFALAQAGIETGLAVPIEEQFREGEWREKVVAPLAGHVFLTIILVASQGDRNEFLSTTSEEGEAWQANGITIRIISARRASKAETLLWVQSRST